MKQARNIKRRLESFSFYNIGKIQSHLEKMAAKGWMITSISSFTWVYQRIPPQKLHFSISYYPKASVFDNEYTPEQQIFHDFCLHTGWKLACTCAQMQIFYNEQEDPTPIETEPALEIQSIHASVKKGLILPYLLLLFASFLRGIILVAQLQRTPLTFLSNPTNLFSTFSLLVLGILCLTELSCYLIWLQRARRQAKTGVFLMPPDTSLFQIMLLWVIFAAFGLWILDLFFANDKLEQWSLVLYLFYIPVLLSLIGGLKAFLKKKKASREMSRFLVILSCVVLSFTLIIILTYSTLYLYDSGFFDAKPPSANENALNPNTLTLNDLGFENPANITYNQRNTESSSFLLSVTEVKFPATITTFGHDLFYEVYHIKVPFLYDFCKKNLLKKIDNHFDLVYEKIEDPAWQAQEVYRLKFNKTEFTNEYLLCYPDKIWHLRLNQTPAKEEKQRAGDKMGS